MNPNIVLTSTVIYQAEKLDGVDCFISRIFRQKIAGFALSVAEPVACIPAINILKLLCLANHPPYTSALHCGFSSSLLSLPDANRNKGSSPLPYHEIENVIVNPAAKSSSRTSHAVLDSSWNFLATSTQAEKGILLVVWTKPASPSSPRHPRRLRLAVFASPSSPRHPRLTVFTRARLLLIAVILERRVFAGKLYSCSWNAAFWNLTNEPRSVLQQQLPSQNSNDKCGNKMAKAGVLEVLEKSSLFG
ncbi:hypothetical protein OUZ56_022382 [Daphnia magna]|uniref:Uncharacterized protein n=1 Tax=Daphnia magna TaxID=35525 RepID=A0ABR0AWX1_9CRUS|nr:hypothetical protein OUZ56_022382 [Daphnia magna]